MQDSDERSTSRVTQLSASSVSLPPPPATHSSDLAAIVRAATAADQSQHHHHHYPPQQHRPGGADPNQGERFDELQNHPQHPDGQSAEAAAAGIPPGAHHYSQQSMIAMYSPTGTRSNAAQLPGSNNSSPQDSSNAHAHHDPNSYSRGLSPPSPSNSPPPQSTGAGGSSRAAPGRKKRTDSNPEDWTRQRKDNHKEVERRRRGAINQGISELADIVPVGAGGEKAKGAVLNRAVAYIRQLKENEAANIEKWTLEKLLMDQAMHDLIEQNEADRTRIATLEREVLELREAKASADAAAITATPAGGGGVAVNGNGSAGSKRQRVD